MSDYADGQEKWEVSFTLKGFRFASDRLFSETEANDLCELIRKGLLKPEAVMRTTEP